MTSQEEVFEVPIKDEFHYRWSYGGLSPFFAEMAKNNRFIGARCPTCKTVWFPPRTTCSKCLRPAEWVPVSSEGEVVCSMKAGIPPASLKQKGFPADRPVVSALVRLDGTDTIFNAMVLAGKKGTVEKGAKVKVVFKEKVETFGDFYFVPVSD